MDLIRLLTLSKEEFRRLYGHTTIAWRGKVTLQRNAAVALGNIGDPHSVSALAGQLRHSASPVLRETCAWALGQIDHPEARRALARARKSERATKVLETMDFLMDGGSTVE